MEILRYNKTLREMMIGSLVFSGVAGIILVIFTKNTGYQLLGLVVGLLVSLFLAYNMADSIDIAVDLDEKSSKAYLQKQSTIRYLVVCAVIIALGLLDWGNPLTCFVGVMGLKIGAYLQPFTHKLLNPNEEKLYILKIIEHQAFV